MNKAGLSNEFTMWIFSELCGKLVLGANSSFMFVSGAVCRKYFAFWARRPNAGHIIERFVSENHPFWFAPSPTTYTAHIWIYVRLKMNKHHSSPVYDIRFRIKVRAMRLSIRRLHRAKNTCSRNDKVGRRNWGSEWTENHTQIVWSSSRSKTTTTKRQPKHYIFG